MGNIIRTFFFFSWCYFYCVSDGVICQNLGFVNSFATVSFTLGSYGLALLLQLYRTLLHCIENKH